MASAEECREALQTLTTRLAEMSPQDRASYFGKRSMSCHVTDLGVTFITRFTDTGAEPVNEAALSRSGAPAPIRQAVADFTERYVLKDRCPADDQLEGVSVHDRA